MVRAEHRRAKRFTLALLASSCMSLPVIAQQAAPVHREVKPVALECAPGQHEKIITFGWDEWVVTPAAREQILEISDAYRGACPYGAISIIAHTDTSGDLDYNVALSLRRAEAVKDIFLSQGIAAERISTEARGESDPAVDTGDGVRENRNRRAVISIVSPSAPAEPALSAARLEPTVAPVLPATAEAPAPSGSMEIKVSQSDVDDRWGVREYRPPSQAADHIADVRIDSFEATPRLNVELESGALAGVPGEDAVFQTYWNYSNWIARASILVFDNSDDLTNAPIAELAVDLQSGQARWTIPQDAGSEGYAYVLRVYGEDGDFDQTVRKSFPIVEQISVGGRFGIERLWRGRHGGAQYRRARHRRDIPHFF